MANSYKFSGPLGGLVAADEEFESRMTRKLDNINRVIRNASNAEKLRLTQKYGERQARAETRGIEAEAVSRGSKARVDIATEASRIVRGHEQAAQAGIKTKADTAKLIQEEARAERAEDLVREEIETQDARQAASYASAAASRARIGDMSTRRKMDLQRYMTDQYYKQQNLELQKDRLDLDRQKYIDLLEAQPTEEEQQVLNELERRKIEAEISSKEALANYRNARAVAGGASLKARKLPKGVDGRVNKDDQTAAFEWGEKMLAEADSDNPTPLAVFYENMSEDDRLEAQDYYALIHAQVLAQHGYDTGEVEMPIELDIRMRNAMSPYITPQGEFKDFGVTYSTAASKLRQELKRIEEIKNPTKREIYFNKVMETWTSRFGLLPADLRVKYGQI